MFGMDITEILKDIFIYLFGTVWAIFKYCWWLIFVIILLRIFPDIFEYLLGLIADRRKVDDVKEEKKSTRYSESLYNELVRRGLALELEKFDGHKTIDIACVPAKLNIEIDGIQHSFYRQAISDLKRTYYSLEKGYVTLRIPNNLLKNNLFETADWVEKIIRTRMPRG